MGDCRVSADPEETLVTYALGSCVAVSIHDAAAHVGGLLHFMLPESALDRAKAQGNPFLFADTGIPLLFRAAYERGAEKRRLLVKVAGGAQVPAITSARTASGKGASNARSRASTGRPRDDRSEPSK